MTLWFYNFAKKNEQKKKIRCLSEKKKKQEKQNNATIMISLDGKGTTFPVQLNLQGDCLKKILKERNSK